jgi:hypothetical protein
MLFGIGARRCGTFVSFENGQRFFSMLPRQVFLSVPFKMVLSARDLKSTKRSTRFVRAAETITSDPRRRGISNNCAYFITHLVMMGRQLVENFFRAATNLSAVLLRICPRRRRQLMRITNCQCLFGVLSRQLLLPVCQIRFGEGLVRVSRFRISK